MDGKSDLGAAVAGSRAAASVELAVFSGRLSVCTGDEAESDGFVVVKTSAVVDELVSAVVVGGKSDVGAAVAGSAVELTDRLACSSCRFSGCTEEDDDSDACVVVTTSAVDVELKVEVVVDGRSEVETALGVWAAASTVG